MARKKEETKVSVKPKTFTFTEEQFKIIKDVSVDLMDIRRKLEDIEGEDNVSTIMFQVGQSFLIANRSEDALDELLDSFENDCEDCDEDY
jgi:hypothetical protein